LADQAKDLEREQLIARADFWYRQALPEAGGLDKKLVQQRIDEIKAEFPDLKRTAPPTAIAAGGTRSGLADLVGRPTTGRPALPAGAGTAVTTTINSSPIPPVFTIEPGTTVYALAFSPDGKHLAAGLSSGGTVVWDLATQRRVLQLAGLTSRLTRLIYSADGDRLAACGYDGVVRVWNTKSGDELYSRPGAGSSSRNDIAFSPDGKRLAHIVSTQRLEICDAATGNVQRQLTGYFAGIAFSPDSQTLAVSETNQLRLTDVAGAKVDKALSTGTSARHISFSPDERTLATLGDDRSLALWDLETGKRILMANESTPHTGLEFSENGKVLMLGARSQIKLLDGRTLKPKLALQSMIVGSSSVSFSSSYLYAVAWTPDSGLMAGAYGSDIHIWNLRSLGKR
jgi:WD40 repeat protein